MTLQSIADDATMNRQLWREREKVISNSLDIDFIHGDIHGWSYENLSLMKYPQGLFCLGIKSASD